jgi:hypothetical protein
MVPLVHATMQTNGIQTNDANFCMRTNGIISSHYYAN